MIITDRIKKQQALQVIFHKDAFDPEKLSSVLYQTVNSLGGWLDFVTSYHPKFNFIEMYWGYVKRKVRNECN